MSYDNDPINAGIVLDLQFKEGAGVKTQDWAKPHHKDPTLVGTPTWTQLDNGLMVLDFNSAHPDSVEILSANCGDLNFTGSNNFSGAVWVKWDSAGGRLFGKSDYGTNGWLIYRYQNRVIFRTFSDGKETTVPNTLTTGTWYLIAFSKSGNNVSMYVNGVNETTTPNSHSPSTSAGVDFTIGKTGPTNFDGQMYRPRIWNRALSKDEIKAIFELERHLFEV